MPTGPVEETAVASGWSGELLLLGGALVRVLGDRWSELSKLGVVVQHGDLAALRHLFIHPLPRLTPEFRRQPKAGRQEFLVRPTHGGLGARATQSGARRRLGHRGLDGSTRAPGAAGGGGIATGPGATGTEDRRGGSATRVERRQPVVEPNGAVGFRLATGARANGTAGGM